MDIDFWFDLPVFLFVFGAIIFVLIGYLYGGTDLVWLLALPAVLTIVYFAKRFYEVKKK